MKKLLAALVLIIPVAAFAAVTEEDKRMVDVYNKYYASIISVGLCKKEQYADEAEKTKFQQNFVMARAVVAKIFQKDNPQLTDEQAIGKIKTMDDFSKETLIKIHKEGGCSHQVLVDALKWFEDFKKLPPVPVN